MLDLAVAESIKEERTRQPVLKRARQVRGLVLQVEVDAPRRGEREGDEVGTRLMEGDEGFIEAIREIAMVPHATFARQFLAQYEERREEAL